VRAVGGYVPEGSAYQWFFSSARFLHARHKRGWQSRPSVAAPGHTATHATFAARGTRASTSATFAARGTRASTPAVSCRTASLAAADAAAAQPVTPSIASGGSPHTGAIVGGVIGGTIVVAVILYAGRYVYRRKMMNTHVTPGA